MEAGEARPKVPVAFDWLPFPDASRFKVLGLPWFEENRPQLWRMPKAKIDSLPSGVQRRCKEPAGGRILLKCDTANLALKVSPSTKASRRGFDVYIDGKFLRSAVIEEPGNEKKLVLFEGLEKRTREILVYLPYQQEIVVTTVGVDPGTTFRPPEHEFAQPLPIVFYGSSVCQGSGAGKSGMSYEAILGRELNVDFINLGFGGAGKAEKVVVDLANSLPACCYVFDLGKSYGMQDASAYKAMLEAVRKTHPDVPIICITPITSSREVHSEEYSQKSIHTRTVMRQAVQEFFQAGHKNVYLLEGPDLLGFEEHDGLSADGVHPSDYGFAIIARKLLPTLRTALAKGHRE